MKVLVFGATGMLGNAMFRLLSADSELDVYGTTRSDASRKFLSENLREKIVSGVDVENQDSVIRVFGAVRPNVVINCVGLVKQLADANDPLLAVPLNTLLPHRLAALCATSDARLIHISTDCVFSGRKGNYHESDFPDAYDLYGRSKLLGEVDYPNAITLRTSIVGHELSGSRSLINWFLSQSGEVEGFTRAVFSGVPTVELSRIVRDYIMPRPDLRGLYHVSSEPINKYDLLNLVAKTYGKSIKINPSERLVIDRSLNSDRLRAQTGYTHPQWPVLIQQMCEFG